MNCPLCQARVMDKREVAFPVLRHFDFADLAPAGRIGICAQCGLLVNALEAKRLGAALATLGTAAYALSEQDSHLVFAAGRSAPRTRAWLQARMMAAAMASAPRAILDVGCNDGRLLTALGQHYPAAELHGLEVNVHLADRFPQGRRFCFWSGDLEQVPGRFDLVVLSHTIMYLPRLGDFLHRLQSRLAPGGWLWVQTPDVTRNPCYLLMGDQYHYFDRNILGGVLGWAGYDAAPLNSADFSREAIVRARPGTSRRTSGRAQRVGAAPLARLAQMAEAMKAIAGADRIGVLGTTANAAFAHGVLGRRVAFFADENSAAGGRFRGLPIRHPQELSPGDRLVLPYGEPGRAVARRMAAHYDGELILI